MNYIGINHGHDSSVALLNKEGQIVFGVEEGKVIGEKNSSKFPRHSLKILEPYRSSTNLCLAEGWNLNKRLLYKGFIHTLKYGSRDTFYFKHRLQKEIVRYCKSIKSYKNLRVELGFNKVLEVGHHKSHAYSLLHSGLRPNSVVLVSDNIAENESVSSFLWDGKNMNLISKLNYPFSIGGIYHQFACHLGFSGRSAPGKVMALSGYGEPEFFEEIYEAINFSIDRKKSAIPSWRIRDTWISFAKKTPMSNLKKSLLKSHGDYSYGVNLSASIQKWFTEVTWNYLKGAIALAREKSKKDINGVGLSGGCALNCKTNQVLIDRLNPEIDDNVVISPWSNDAGTAIGAATYSYLRANPWKGTISSPFIGKVNSNPVISKLDIIKATNDIIAGKIISLVSGALEFGPRALGGRCILANPAILSMRDKLNLIKDRPSFMPFAPAVLQSSYSFLFEGKASKYMTTTVTAKELAIKQYPAAVHIDNSARVQLVYDTDDSILCKLLKAMKKETGYGILLLTSLNGKNKPFDYFHDIAVDTSIALELHGCVSDLGYQVH